MKLMLIQLVCLTTNFINFVSQFLKSSWFHPHVCSFSFKILTKFSLKVVMKFYDFHPTCAPFAKLDKCYLRILVEMGSKNEMNMSLKVKG